MQLVLEIGLVVRAHHDDVKLLIIFDIVDRVRAGQHILVQQISDREQIGVVTDRHHGDDLLTVEKQGQRPLHDDGGLDLLTVLVDPGDRLGQSRVVRIRANEKAR